MDKKQIQKIDELLNEFDTGDKPGVVVGLSQDGKTEFAKAYGMANLEYGLPLLKEMYIPDNQIRCCILIKICHIP